MQAGKLRERITIRQRQATTDALGQPSTTWTDLAVVWAEARFVSGIETIKAGRETSTSRASVRIRRRSGVDVSMRARIGSVDYEIIDIIPINRAYMTLLCEVVK